MKYTKHTSASLSIVLLAVTIMSVSALDQNAYATHDYPTFIPLVETPVGGLTLSAGGIEGSTTIDVSGTTDQDVDIALKVIAPNGNIVGISQITPSDGSFATTIEVGGPLWSQDGMYTISAHQGTATSYQPADSKLTLSLEEVCQNSYHCATAEVEIVDGHVIPEFGVIAVMILAVAIVSIIVVTAKTKLSIVPRY